MSDMKLPDNRGPLSQFADEPDVKSMTAAEIEQALRSMPSDADGEGTTVMGEWSPMSHDEILRSQETTSFETLSTQEIGRKVRALKFIAFSDSGVQLCAIRMENGHVFVGMNQLVDPRDDRVEFSRTLAYQDAILKAWQAETYLLRERIFQTAQLDEMIQDSQQRFEIQLGKDLEAQELFSQEEMARLNAGTPD